VPSIKHLRDIKICALGTNRWHISSFMVRISE
jgi:hypothetical protein